MASSSSSSQIKRYHVFPSFHGPDVRRGFLSHLHNLFARKGITMFKDQKIERGHTIGPELVKGIRESKLSVVLLSKNYASSSWCLDELVEILKCKEDSGQLVMTIFYNVDPSDVRKQKGDFGSVFEKTCKGKTEEEKQKWIEAMQYVATIAGEHSINWDDEAALADKFATDVSNELNLTPSRDFDGMVGMEAHLREVSSLLCLKNNAVKIIGIWGPAGIGKTTIARALYNHLASQFPLRCFMESYKSIVGVDGNYESKLWLQNQLLSRILNQGGISVRHLGAIKEWLQDQRVLSILDDVDDLEILEVLAGELSWFGLGSRIIVTTEDPKILKAHRINDIYHVPFPSKKEALEILCQSAFKQRFVQDGFEEVARKVAKLCGNLPLRLRVVGSYLRGQSKREWELQLSKMETNTDRKIEDVLRMGYDKLSKKAESLSKIEINTDRKIEEVLIMHVGIVHVKFVRAVGLRTKYLIGGADPYVKIELFEDKVLSQKTNVKYKNLNPEWNEEFKFSVKDPQTQILTFTVYDWEEVGKHDKMGMNVLALKEMVPDEHKSFNLELRKTLKGNDDGGQPDKNRGKLEVELMYKPFTEEEMLKGTPVAGGLIAVLTHLFQRGACAE